MAQRTECYVDTSALIAFLDRSDSYHALFKRHEDGDVQFCLAVFLLILIAPLTVVLSSRWATLAPLLLSAAAIPVRTFVRSLRRLR
jgi:hypothetical protein